MRPGSDVDILVEFEPGTHPGLSFFRLEEELSELFGRRVDLGRKSLLKPLVRPSVLRGAIRRLRPDQSPADCTPHKEHDSAKQEHRSRLGN
ncbi:hypothetical protein SBA6_100031 [Candidatus Sulfopaludibacter sp. SbA6]|nr:hypothetical protein SBA6_100031 [Candidatus Sulfopaludibacter sp. SbA6]